MPGSCCGEDHGVRPLGDAAVVLDRDLGLSVRPEVRQRRVLADLRELPRETMGERDGERHEVRRLAHREAEHHPLIPGAELVGIFALARFESMIDALRDLARLLLAGDDYDYG